MQVLEYGKDEVVFSQEEIVRRRSLKWVVGTIIICFGITARLGYSVRSARVVWLWLTGYNEMCGFSPIRYSKNYCQLSDTVKGPVPGHLRTNPALHAPSTDY